jgi:hypothetical protein
LIVFATMMSLVLTFTDEDARPALTSQSGHREPRFAC